MLLVRILLSFNYYAFDDTRDIKSLKIIHIIHFILYAKCILKVIIVDILNFHTVKNILLLLLILDKRYKIKKLRQNLEILVINHYFIIIVIIRFLNLTLVV